MTDLMSKNNDSALLANKRTACFPVMTLYRRNLHLIERSLKDTAQKTDFFDVVLQFY